MILPRKPPAPVSSIFIDDLGFDFNHVAKVGIFNKFTPCRWQRYRSGLTDSQTIANKITGYSLPLKISFRRSTLSTEFIPEIDGLRFFAILTVAIFHLNTAFSKEIGLGSDLGIAALGGKQNLLQLGWWIIRLDLGVKVFFAISGFVLALPFLKQNFPGNEKKIVLKEYYMRRLTRLEPPFVISLILFTLVHIFIMHASWNSMANHFWAGLLYSHVLIFGESNPINPVTWSLETEAQFYILVPLIFAGLFSFKSNAGKIALGVGVFIGSVFLKGYLLKNNLNHLSESILAYMSNFTTGIAFACLFLLDKKNRLKTKTFLWDIAGVLAIFMIFYFYKPQALWINNIFFNSGIFILMIAAFKGKFMNRFFTNKFVFTTGGMCYSIYLLHFAFFHLLVKYTSPLTTGMGYVKALGLQLCMALPIILFISGIFFLLIEKPCMNKRWPKQLIGFFKGERL